jgi:NADH:ubiquinone oxidoreductase subunit E
LAPVISVDGEFHAGVDPKNVSEILRKYRKGEVVEK